VSAISSLICAHLSLSSSFLYSRLYGFFNSRWDLPSSAHRRHLPLSVPSSHPLCFQIFGLNHVTPLVSFVVQQGVCTCVLHEFFTYLYIHRDFYSLISVSRYWLWLSLHLVLIIHTHTHARTHARAHTHRHRHRDTDTHTHTQTHTHTDTHTHRHTHTHIYIYITWYVRIYFMVFSLWL
jgi:hypothetical protein